MSVLFWSFVSAILGIVLYFWHVSRKSANFWPQLGIPVVGSEVLGNIYTNITNRPLQHELDEKVYKHIKQLTKPLKYIGMMEMSKPVLFLTDLDLARQIFIKDFDVFMDRRKIEAMESIDPMFFKMIFFMEGEPWRELRSKITPTFTTGKIRRMFEIFNTSSSDLVKFLQSEASKDWVVDLKDGYERYTMAVIASAAFGIDAKTFEQEDAIFQKMGKRLELELSPLLIMKFILMSIAPRVSQALKFGLFDEEAEKFFANIIKSTIRHREESGDVRDDFLQLMLEVRNGQLKAVDESELNSFEKEAGVTANRNRNKLALTELTDDVIIAQSVLFILAGFETTISLLLFAVYELALNPDIQQQLSNEVEDALSKNDGKFTYDLIMQMEYLDKVVNETLRKYPPVTRLERRAVADYQIPDTELVIPKDVLIAIPTYSIHHDKTHFPNPERFDPERFSNESKSTRHPYAFQPFGHGPRNCIGMRFALTNAKMAIAKLVHNFALEPTAKTLIPVKFAKVSSLKPESMFLKLVPRTT